MATILRPAAAAPAYRRVPLTMMSAGFMLGSAIHDQDMRLLLGAGLPVTQELIISLHKRGVRTVVVSDADWHRLTAFKAHGKARQALPNRGQIRSDLQNEATEELDHIVHIGQPCPIFPSEDPFSQKIQHHGSTSYDQAKADRVVANYRGSVDQVKGLLETLSRDQSVAAEKLRDLSQSFLTEAADDLDLFVCMGINPSANNSIFSHSTNVAMLAVAIGATLGLDEETLSELGVGCMVHDAGMLQIDPNVVQADHVLNESEFIEIAKHPIIAADLLYKNSKQVPVGVRMVVYQMHERGDGSGYPRGCTAEKIHPLAKIASVADAYVALVSKRPHRPAMLPYFAMTKLLNDVNSGLFDSAAVRALLHTVSLFPIGSFVELSNGQIGKTIRANGPAYDRPMVEVREREGKTTSKVVDLTEQTDVKVLKAITESE